jgi:hypothetical protein
MYVQFTQFIFVSIFSTFAILCVLQNKYCYSPQEEVVM